MRIVPGIWLRTALCLFVAALPARGADAPPASSLQIASYEVAANRDAPEACILFSESISRQPNAALDSFVAVDPAVTLSVSSRDHRLCLTGFGFGASYAVTLKPGLPGTLHALAQEARLQIAIPDRPPEFDFAETGNVLPRIGASGLQLRSVNISKLDVAVFHIPDRDLLRRVSGGLSPDASSATILTQDAEQIWRGTIGIKDDPNHDVVTAMQVEQTIGALQPGLYLAIAHRPGLPAASSDPTAIARYFSVSDLGLTSYRTPDALLVAVRSLATAAAAAGVDIALIGENNRELARVRTDGSGLSRFDPALLRGRNGDRPRAVFAYGAAGEFSYLDFDAAPLNLTGNDAASRPLGGASQAMIVPDRGTYRPGDTVRLTALLRDDQGRAISKSPLTLKIAKPDGAAFESRVLNEQGAGSYDLSLGLPVGAPAGAWQVTAYLDLAEPPVGNAVIQVEDDVPSRLSVGLSLETAIIDPAQPGAVDIHGQYSFGAPAAATPGELGLSIRAATNPIPAFPDFSFGLADEQIEPVIAEPQRFITDAAGKANPALKIGDLPHGTKPIEARITAALLDIDGIRVERGTAAPIADQPLLLGIKSPEGPNLDPGHPAHFEIIAVSPDGARQEKAEADWEIRRREPAPDWYWTGSRWAFGRAIREIRAAAGSVQIAAAQPSVIDANLPEGEYEIELFDPKGAAASSLHFRVGWSATTAGIAAEPSVQVKISKMAYMPGESAEIFVKPPYDAEIILVATDRTLRGTQIQHVPAAGATMHVDIPRDGSGGLHVLATALAPSSGTPPAGPRRAIGLGWLPIDQTARRLDVKLDAPEKIAPGRLLSVPVSVVGAGDEAAFVALTAVDENALQAAGLSPPDPLDFFLGKRAFGMKIHDLYGQVLAAPHLSGPLAAGSAPSEATFRQASDPVLDGSPAISLYSGIVALDKSGKAVIPLTAPAFICKLRLVAIAWSASRLGHADAPLIVRYPLAAEISPPRFLTPDDHADLNLALDNVDGPRGEYRIGIKAEGALSIQGDAEIVANLAEHEQRNQTISLQAHGPGESALTLAVQGPGGISFERRLAAPVRAAGPLTTRHAAAIAKPAAQLALDGALLEGLRPDTIALSMALASGPAIDLQGAAAELAHGDYGSTEQIVSAATPFLGAPAASLADGRLQRAVLRILGAQTADGGFGLWGPAESDPWLTIYAADFLGRAKSAGAWIPEDAFRRSLDYLSRYADPLPGQDATPADLDQASQTALDIAAYANAVLAKNGRRDLFELRYFADRFLGRMHAPVSIGWVGAAYAALGDQVAARAAFTQALALPSPAVATDAFASELRDQAALVALMAESGNQSAGALAKAAARAAELAASRRQFSAQEDAWILRAAKSFGGQDEPLKLQVDGKIVQSRGVFMLASKPGAPVQLPSIKNLSDKPLHGVITVTGTAVAPDPKEGGGYEIQRWFFDPSGKPADPAVLRQNDLLVAVITGRFTGQGDPHPLIASMLPSGWTLEAAEIANPVNRFPWLKDLTGANHVERREDSYVAIPKLVGDRREFKVAYVVRAAIPGQFAVPGALIEDTEKPSLFARSPSSRTKIDRSP